MYSELLDDDESRPAKRRRDNDLDYNVSILDHQHGGHEDKDGDDDLFADFGEGEKVRNYFTAQLVPMFLLPFFLSSCICIPELRCDVL